MQDIIVFHDRDLIVYQSPKSELVVTTNAGLVLGPESRLLILLHAMTRDIKGIDSTATVVNSLSVPQNMGDLIKNFRSHAIISLLYL